MNPYDKLTVRVYGWVGVYVSVRTQFYTSGRVAIKLCIKNMALELPYLSQF